MLPDLSGSVLGILSPDGIRGATFLVAPRLALTCTNVVSQASERVGNSFPIRLQSNTQIVEAFLRAGGWHPAEDIAIFGLIDDLPLAACLPLGWAPFPWERWIWLATARQTQGDGRNAQKV